jgi:OpgC protein
VFCFGIFLSFGAHFVLVEVSGALGMQVLVSVTGIALMTALASYRSWSKRVDRARPQWTTPPHAERRLAQASQS